MYTAITLNGNTDVYLHDQPLYRCVTSKVFFKDKFYIEDVNNIKVLELDIKHFIGFNKRFLIKNQNLNKKIELYKMNKKLNLRIDGKTILLNKKIRAWKFEGDFIVNDKILGSFNNRLKPFKSSFTFDFETESEINLYCIVLFSIFVVDEFNTRPPS
ncbi:hypothetical protein NU10_07770 [Flavobacterium dauae]|uniref:hypothetical protein n=1 Tax=Flavobacterium dauae TaxID=1563479 RepID=UPI00101B3EDC|nr:hypothetical protein [Flavobacterium dauae]WLD22635.1 hypothetical protein NU10_07770 [Flavobacterium dauae]